MTPFRRLTGIAAPLPIANVDTDMIIPGAFIKTVSRQGLGRGLFHNLRADGDFVLDRAPWDRSRILITLDNFGCGSSREHAAWALQDFGISCILAPSFAEIFQGNCFKNGMLPVVLPRVEIDLLLADAADPETAALTVDLETEAVIRADGSTIPFHIDAQCRSRLLNGVDDIAFALGFQAAIGDYEESVRRSQPWLAGMGAA